MKRIYESLLKDHFINNRQMAFLSGPRQVGKTTTATETESKYYLNWDTPRDRTLILKGPQAIIENKELASAIEKNSRIIFDEIHKFPKWKNFLKGFFDIYQKDYSIIVTGSASLNIYKRGSDSLMGRYFNYRMHPFSPGEIVKNKYNPDQIISKPKKISSDQYKALIEFGGFPEPFLKADKRFYNRWTSLRTEQLFKEDLRNLTSINEIDQLSIMARLLETRTGQLINYSKLANDIQVSVNTIKNWISTLEEFFYCFRIKPWHNNVPKTLLKQPKIYLRDWSIIKDPGAKYENFIACQLLKTVEFWTDAGFGSYELFFLRDKAKREVDFLITNNDEPWFLVEAKSSSAREISPSLKYFSNLLNIKHAFQVDIFSEFIDRDCFEVTYPIKVPAITLLSQLI